MSSRKQGQSGDTLIEVLLAMTLLSAILFITWGLINRSSQISLAARQRVVMVNALKEQAEILKTRFPIQSDKSFGSAPTLLTANMDNPCDDSRGSSGQVNGATPTGSFHFNTSAQPALSTRSIPGYNSNRVWIQHKVGVGYIDYYVRACWQTSGGRQIEDNSQFIVRLNV